MAFFRKDENTTGGPGAATMRPASTGLPGAQRDDSISPDMAAMLLTAPSGQRRIGPEEVVWEEFLPCTTEDLVEVAYVIPWYWDGQLHHVEAGRK